MIASEEPRLARIRFLTPNDMARLTRVCTRLSRQRTGSSLSTLDYAARIAVRSAYPRSSIRIFPDESWSALWALSVSLRRGVEQSDPSRTLRDAADAIVTMGSAEKKGGKRLSHRALQVCVDNFRRAVTAIGSARPRMRFLQRSLGIVDFLHSWGEFRSAMSMLMWMRARIQASGALGSQPAGVLGGLQRNLRSIWQMFQNTRNSGGNAAAAEKDTVAETTVVGVLRRTCQIFIKAAYSTTYVTPEETPSIRIACESGELACRIQARRVAAAQTAQHTDPAKQRQVYREKRLLLECREALARALTLHAQHIGLLMSRSMSVVNATRTSATLFQRAYELFQGCLDEYKALMGSRVDEKMDVVGPAGAASEPRDGKRVTVPDSTTTSSIQLGDNELQELRVALAVVGAGLGECYYCHSCVQSYLSNRTHFRVEFVRRHGFHNAADLARESIRLSISAVEKLVAEGQGQSIQCAEVMKDLGKVYGFMARFASTEKEAMELAQNKKVWLTKAISVQTSNTRTDHANVRNMRALMGDAVRDSDDEVED